MNLPSTKESLTFLIALAAWMIVTALFIGIRPEHWLMGALLAFLFFITPSTRKLSFFHYAFYTQIGNSLISFRRFCHFL